MIDNFFIYYKRISYFTIKHHFPVNTSPFSPSIRRFLAPSLDHQLCSAPDHLASLRNGIRYPACAPVGAGAFGASPAQALGRGGRTVDGMRMIPPRS